MKKNLVLPAFNPLLNGISEKSVFRIPDPSLSKATPQKKSGRCAVFDELENGIDTLTYLLMHPKQLDSVGALLSCYSLNKLL